MRYIDKVICGEKAFKDFAKRIRPLEKLQMLGTIGHLGDIRVEHFYEKKKGEENFSEFYWMSMPSNKEDVGFTECQFSDKRAEIYEGIRNGSITGRV